MPFGVNGIRGNGDAGLGRVGSDLDIAQGGRTAGVALHVVTPRRDQIAGGIHAKGAVLRQVFGAGHRIHNLEKARARDGQIALVAGVGDAAFSPIAANAGDFHPSAHLHGRRRRARALQRIAERVGKIDCACLECGGVDVGNVIANDIHLFLEVFESADSCA